MLDNTTNQPDKFRFKNWVKINDDSRRTYNINDQIKLKTSTQKLSLCNYGGTHMLLSYTIATQRNNPSKHKGILKNTVIKVGINTLGKNLKIQE